MKIQSFAVIFIIIILPISLVFASYTQNRVETINLQTRYDSKLNDATYDALKAYQLNSFNSDTSDLTNAKIRDIKASASTFFNSMASGFSELGYTKSTLQNYVPALVYTMYDGYYIYSPYKNTWDDETNEKHWEDKSYHDGDELYGLKPYVYYSCRYQKLGKYDVTITYSLDNYIQIQGYVVNRGRTETISQSGYLLSIANDNTSDGVYYDETSGKVYYNGQEIGEESSLKENVYVDGKYIKGCEYIKKNGIKYYLDKNNDLEQSYSGNVFSVINGKSNIQTAITEMEFYGNEVGSENLLLHDAPIMKSVPCKNMGTYKYYLDFDENYNGKSDCFDFPCYRGSYIIVKVDQYNNKEALENIEDEIEHNTNAKNYYIEAWNLANFIKNYEIDDIEISNIVEENRSQYTETEEGAYHTQGKIFNFDNIESPTSNFNTHRIEVIKHSIERNLSIAISNFNAYSSVDFKMPKLKETDWDKIMNNISIISFLQGVNIGGKIYNGYAVVTNTKNEDIVMEDSIYIKDNNAIFHRITEENLPTGSIGIYNVNIERRTAQDDSGNNVYYLPVEGTLSYDSIVTQNKISKTSNQTISEYVKGLDDDLKKLYYTALGRERYGLYRQKLTISPDE